MEPYLRVVWQDFTRAPRTIFFAVALAPLMVVMSALALVTGRAFWAPLAMLVGAGLFVLLYAYLLQLAVRRTREDAGELAAGHERDVSDR